MSIAINHHGVADESTTSAQTVSELGAEKTSANAMDQQSLFVFIYQVGPAWQPDKPLEKQNLREHAGYMKALLDKKILVMAGPFGEIPGGMVLLQAKNLLAAKEIAQQDPAVINKVFTVEVFTWTPRFFTENAARSFIEEAH